MTREYREYAKSRIEYLLKISSFVFDERDKEALGAAIQALSQEPCEDAVSREFIEITTHYPPSETCIYPEYNGKPYYSIKYRENEKTIVGYGTYSIEVLSRYLKEYFIPSVTQKSETVTEFADRCRECGKMRKGHWIYDETIENWRCSKCNETPKTMGYVGTADFMAEHFKFCNHCGAKMVEPQESEDKQ